MIPEPLPFQGKIGKYQLIRPLGSGGMGAVYLARHERLTKSRYAIKFVHAVASPELRQRFEREIDALDGLNHPNIVRVVDADKIDGTPYLVMEYVAGLDLQRLLERVSTLSVADSCALGMEIAAGLKYLHRRGLVHRDIKPANALLATDGRCKILDLGLARMLVDANQLTGSNQLFGTPDFMSPEQCQGTGEAGPASDIYSLGCTLYYLLAGRAPFGDEQHSTPQSKYAAHLLEEPPGVRTIRADVAVELEDLLRAMLAKSPAHRMASAAEAEQALAPFSDGARLSQLAGALTEEWSHDMRDVPTTPLNSAQVDTEQSSLAEPRRGGYARWNWLMLCGVVALAIAALVIAIAPPWRSDDVGNGEDSASSSSDQVVERQDAVGGGENELESPINRGVREGGLPDPSTVRDHDRTVAAWVIQMGGECGIDDGNDTYVGLYSMKDAPSFFRLQQIDFRNCRRRIDNDLIATLDGYRLPDLRSVLLDGTQITDAVIPLLAQFELDDLGLEGTAVTDKGVSHVVGMPILSSVDLANTSISDDSLPRLATIKYLMHIDISDCPNLSERAVADFIARRPDVDVQH